MLIIWIIIICICLAIIVTLVGGYFLFRFIKKRSKAKSDANPSIAQEVTAALNLDLVFKSGFRSLRKITGRSKRMYEVPTMLMVGLSGSGKSTLMNDSGFKFIQTKPTPETFQSLPCTFWHTTYGSIIELQGRFTTGSLASNTFNTLYKQLSKFRPRKLIDGIVFVVPMDELLSENISSELNDLTQNLRSFVIKSNQQVPFYVIVTKSDTQQGLKQFNILNQKQSEDLILGWSNERELQKNYSSDDFEKDFQSLLNSTLELRLNLIASSKKTENLSDLFLVYNELENCQQPLNDVVNGIALAGSYLPQLKYRGFYFTGNAYKRDNTIKVAFSKALFLQKIFKEHTIASPYSKSSEKTKYFRNMSIFIGATLALFLVLFYVGANKLNKKIVMTTNLVDLQHALIAKIKPTNYFDKVMRLPPKQQNEIIADELVPVLSYKLPELRTLLLPISYLSSLSNSIYNFVFTESQSLMFYYIKQKIYYIYKTLVPEQHQLFASDTAYDPSEHPRMQKFIGDVTNFVINASYLEDFTNDNYPPINPTKMDKQHFNQLIQYTLGKQVSDVMKHYYQKKGFWHALRTISVLYKNPLVEYEHESNMQWYKVATSRFSAATNEMIGSANEITQLLPKLGSQAQRKATVKELNQKINRLNNLLTSDQIKAKYDKHGTTLLEFSKIIDGVKKNKRLLSILKSTDQIQVETSQALNKAVTHLLTLPCPYFGKLAYVNPKDNRVLLNKNLLFFNNFLGQFIGDDSNALAAKSSDQFHLKEKTPTVFLLSSNQLSDTLASINKITALLKGLHKSNPKSYYDVSKLNSTTVDYYIANRIKSSVSNITEEGPTTDLQKVKLVHANLASNLTTLSKLVQSLTKYNLHYSTQLIGDLIARQSFYLLNTANQLLNKEKLFFPNEDSLQWKNVNIPIAYKLYGVQDKASLENYLKSQFERMKILVAVTEPALLAPKILTKNPMAKEYIGDNKAYSVLSGRWTSISHQLQLYSSKNPKSSLKLLEAFITGPLMQNKYEKFVLPTSMNNKRLFFFTPSIIFENSSNVVPCLSYFAFIWSLVSRLFKRLIFWFSSFTVALR